MTSSYTIRSAQPSDTDALVAFTIAEGLEAEHARLSEDAVRRGVAGAFGDPPLARYWVAEQSGRIVAHASVVTEWSDFHGGFYWWIQSLYLHPEHRGGGLVEMLLEHLASKARKADALDLRLYAHASNARALRVYERCGFKISPYVVMRRRLNATDRHD
jgi:GNAT superfamily N-acetyltransferase